MKEEIINEGMSNLKKTIIGVITTAVTAVGAYITTHINEVFGLEDESETPTEVVAPVENNNTQNVNVSGPEIIINVPQQTVPTQTIVRETVREVPVQQPQTQTEPVEEKPETPAERMLRLKKLKEEQNGGK